MRVPFHRSRLAIVGLGLVVAGGIAGCAALETAGLAPVLGVVTRTDQPLAVSLAPLAPPTPPPPPPSPAHLERLVNPSMSLYAPPVAVPLEFRIPSQGVSTSILAVGKTPGELIDAPEGPANDPVWTKAFWFRGGATPGDAGVTTIIGHVDDTRARPDPFAKIKNLSAGDIVEVVDQRTGGIIHYRVTSTEVVWNNSFTTARLAHFFGTGAVTQKPSDKAADAASGVARLTMMTCTGAWRGGGFDRRFFVFGVRDESVRTSS